MANRKFRVVVGLDFSEPGALAVAQAVRVVGDRPEGELHVVHVVTSEDLGEVPGATKLEQQNQALKALPGKIWARIRELGATVPEAPAETHVSIHVRFGEPAEVLIQVAADYDAHLLVVGTHGRSGMDRLLVGSVAERLVRIAKCPVLVVRPNELHTLPKTERLGPPASPSELSEEEARQVHTYVASDRIQWTTHDSEAAGPTGIRMI